MNEPRSHRAVEEALRELAPRRAPLPAQLARRLRAIPRAARRSVRQAGEEPWPRVPMSADLRRRLVEVPDRPVLPRWLRDTRWAVAASLSLALLAGLVTGGPERLGRRVVETATATERLARDTSELIRTRTRNDLEAARERWLTGVDLPSPPWNLFPDPKDREQGDLK